MLGRGLRPQFVRPISGPLHFEVTIDGRRECLQILRIGADHDVAPPKGSFDEAGIDDIGRSRLACEGSNPPREVVVQCLDVTPAEEAGELGLSAASPPCLGDDRGGYGRRRPGNE